MDLELTLQSIMQSSPLSIPFTKVCGHADDKDDFDYNIAPQPTKRNIDVDILAENFLQHASFFPGQGTSFLIDHFAVTGDIRERIQHQIYSDVLQIRIGKSLSLSQAYLSHIMIRTYTNNSQ